MQLEISLSKRGRFHFYDPAIILGREDLDSVEKQVLSRIVGHWIGKGRKRASRVRSPISHSEFDAPPAGCLRIGIVMSDHKHRKLTSPRMVKDEIPELLAQTIVEFGKRLVQKQGFGLRQERPHQRNACPLAPRERRRIAIYETPKPSHFQSALDMRAPFAPTTNALSKAKGKVVADRQMREEQIVLK
jgi:hypothetical protein